MIYNQDNAVKLFVEYLNSKDMGARVVADYNKGRHKVVETKTGERFYCVYKREFFNKFGVVFQSFCSSNPLCISGLGESLNESSVEKAIEMKATTLVFIHPDVIYTIYSAQFFRFALNNNLRRTQIKENADSGVAIQEKTLSVPKELLKVLI